MRSVATRRERTARVGLEVLDAARREFLAAGYHGASLDRIAAAAGFTKGAVYSRFASKADLFLALLEARIEARAAENEAAAATVAGSVGLTELARRWVAQQRDDLAWTLLVVEFRVHAARDPELNARYAALHERTMAGITAVLERVLGTEGPHVRRFADALYALGTGATLEQAVDAAAIDDDGVVRAVEAIAAAHLGGTS